MTKRYADMKRADKLTEGNNSVTVYWNKEWDEYVCALTGRPAADCHIGYHYGVTGSRLEALNEARDTARAMLKEANAKRPQGYGK